MPFICTCKSCRNFKLSISKGYLPHRNHVTRTEMVTCFSKQHLWHFHQIFVPDRTRVLYCICRVFVGWICDYFTTFLHYECTLWHVFPRGFLQTSYLKFLLSLHKHLVFIIHRWCVCVRVCVCFLTLLTPFHLLDLVHSALEDVALVRLDSETGNVPQVGWQQLSQLLDVAALQLPSPLFQTAGKKEKKHLHRQPWVSNIWMRFKMLGIQPIIFFWYAFYFLK